MYETPGSRTIRTVTQNNIFRVMPRKPDVTGFTVDATYAYDGAHTGFETDLREGLIMAAITSSGLAAPCKCTYTASGKVASTSLAVDNARTFKANDTISVKSVDDVLIVKHDASAASNGVAIYVHVDELDGQYAHFESVAAGNADYNVDLVGGGRFRVEDDDAAATGGVLLYFDEDATNPDERFLANLSTGKDAFVKTTNGRFIRIKYNATPSSAGVQVYGDDDGATVSQRFLFVSPTTTSGTIKTDSDVKSVGSTDLVTLASGLTVSSVNYSTNTITIDSASSWGEDCFAVASGALAGLELARGISNERLDLWSDPDRAAVDKEIGFVVTGNAQIQASAVLGDYAACRAYPGNFLDKLEFYSNDVRI